MRSNYTEILQASSRTLTDSKDSIEALKQYHKDGGLDDQKLVKKLNKINVRSETNTVDLEIKNRSNEIVRSVGEGFG